MRYSWDYYGYGYDFFGPTIQGPHSPDERASISSSQKFWKFLMEVLENIPLK
jgi:dipeptidase D